MEQKTAPAKRGRKPAAQSPAVNAGTSYKVKKKEGKKVTCSYNTSKGRCGMIAVEGGTRCTIHQEVEQRKDGKTVQCKKIKNNKQRCGVMTTNKSGYCYYHD